MAEILQPGQSGWFKCRDGVNAFLVRLPKTKKAQGISMWRNGSYFGEVSLEGRCHSQNIHQEDVVVPLPECTGYDWKPNPKYVPWTLDTMPPHVLVKRISDGEPFAARPATRVAGLIGYCAETYRTMFDNYKQLDGTPCGTISDE